MNTFSRSHSLDDCGGTGRIRARGAQRGEHPQEIAQHLVLHISEYLLTLIKFYKK